MKRLLFLLVAISIVCDCVLNTHAAVGFAISPSTIANTNAGIVNLQITGLNSGEIVQVNHYFDVNGNAAVDAADWLEDSFQLTDGQAAVIAGVTNINVPGDVNATAGAITAPLDFSILSFEEKIIGRHFYVVSSPTARFAAITSTLTITNADFGQSISGNVTSGGAAVPNAIIILLVPSSDGAEPTTGVACDAAGHFSIKASPGNYTVAPFKNGFVTQFSIEPNVNLASGVSTTVAPTLAASDRTISGRLTDAANSSIGIAGLQLSGQADNGGFALAFSDATGAFSLAVNSGNWKIGVGDDSLRRRGLLRPARSTINATAGGVNNFGISVAKETALIYGKIVDQQGKPLAGAAPFASDQGNLSARGISDSNGNFVIAAVQGTWNFDFDPPIDSTLLSYVFPGGGNNINAIAGAATLFNVVALKATSTISGFLRNSSGQPISGVDVFANTVINDVNYSSQGTSDSTGFFQIPVTDGSWNLNVDCDYMQSHGFSCNSQNVVTVNGNNPSVGLVPGQIAPQILTTAAPNGELQQSYFVTLNGTGNGPLTWTLSGGNLPTGLNLSSSGVISGIPTALGVFPFTVRLTTGNTFAEAGYSITVPLAGLGWSRKAFMPTARSGPAAVSLNGKMYVVGGFGGATFNTLEAYDPARGTWQTLPPMHVGRGRLAASVLNGKIYVAGGFGDANAGTALEVFDPATSQWTTLASLKSSRYGCASGVVDNKLFVIGGTSDPIRSVEIYDPVANSWSYGEPVPTSRFLLTAAVVNNKLYAIGGAANNQSQGVVEMYDPVTDSWAPKASIPFSASEAAAAVVNGKIYVCGGFTSSFYSYNPATDQWTPLTDALTARGDVAAAVVGDSFLVVGGETAPGQVNLPILEQYRTTTGDPVRTALLNSDLNVQAAGIGFGVPSIAKFDRLNAGTTTGLTLASALAANNAQIFSPDGAPRATQVITIPPGDGQNGFFKTKFTLPASFVDAQLSFAFSADDMARVFLNGVALTPVMAQGEQYVNRFFSVTTPSLFHAGDNELLIANANYLGGASAVAFYAIMTYRGVISLGAPVRSSPTQFQFSAAVEPPQTYTVEYTTDLKTWNFLQNVNPASTSITITDPNAGGTFRAYRMWNP
jgi:N-acetylneuraminic acid mutarotase